MKSMASKIVHVEVSVDLDGGPSFLDKLSFSKEGEQIHIGVLKGTVFYAYSTFTAKELLSIIKTLGIEETQE